MQSADQIISALADGDGTPENVAETLGSDIEALSALEKHLKRDLTIDAIERVEAAAKLILHRSFAAGVNDAAALSIARFQQTVGLLFKYKPYAVKCASPLGYSIFLQNEGEGFSFQRHVTHKTEVFHILSVMPGGYVFLCEYEYWHKVYEREAFGRWLAGVPDERYDRQLYRPQPGDVFIIDRLNVVHTIVGCVVEEFATVSTDMVDRLHDQNARKAIPPYFDRAYATAALSGIDYPQDSRVVHGWDRSREITPIVANPVAGGSVRVLTDSFVRACHYDINEHHRGPLLRSAERASSIYVTGGSGQLVVGAQRSTLTMRVAAGDLLAMAPDVGYRFVNDGSGVLGFSEHQIAADVAFSPTAQHAVSEESL